MPPRPDGLLTADQAKGMIQEIVGLTVAQLIEKQRDDQASRDSFLDDVAYASKHGAQRRRSGSLLKDLDDDEKKEVFTQILICLAVGNGRDIPMAAKYAKDHDWTYAEKALGTSTIGAGGALIEAEVAAEIIPFLRANTIVLELGAMVMPMDSGILNVGRVGSGAVAAYRAESANATYSAMTFEEVELRARILDVLTASSEQLISRSGGRGASIIQQDLIDGANDKMDATFIRSDGSVNKPRGMLYLALAANKFNETNAVGTTGASTVAEITLDLGTAIQKQMDNDVPFRRPGWGISARTWKRLFTALDGNGNPVWRAELGSGQSPGTIFGFPWRWTTNIPQNLTADAGSGAGSDASEVYFATFQNLIVGETEALRVKQSTEAAYNDGSGLKSSFQRGEILYKVELEHDLVDRHGGKSIVVIESVTWGTV